jgi:hypothetical protein
MVIRDLIGAIASALASLTKLADNEKYLGLLKSIKKWLSGTSKK